MSPVERQVLRIDYSRRYRLLHDYLPVCRTSGTENVPLKWEDLGRLTYSLDQQHRLESKPSRQKSEGLPVFVGLSDLIMPGTCS